MSIQILHQTKLHLNADSHRFFACKFANWNKCIENAKGILRECIELAGEDIKSHFVAVSNIISWISNAVLVESKQAIERKEQ